MISAKETREDGYFYYDTKPIPKDSYYQKQSDEQEDYEKVKHNTVPFLSKDLEFNLKLDQAKNPQSDEIPNFWEKYNNWPLGLHRINGDKLYGLFYGNNELYGVTFDRKVLEQKKKNLTILNTLAIDYLKDCNNTRFKLDEQLREKLKGEKTLGEQAKIYAEYQQEISKLGKKKIRI